MILSWNKQNRCKNNNQSVSLIHCGFITWFCWLAICSRSSFISFTWCIAPLISWWTLKYLKAHRSTHVSSSTSKFFTRKLWTHLSKQALAILRSWGQLAIIRKPGVKIIYNLCLDIQGISCRWFRIHDDSFVTNWITTERDFYRIIQISIHAFCDPSVMTPSIQNHKTESSINIIT